jgi:recombinational DNA repair protein (RecF pathway)
MLYVHAKSVREERSKHRYALQLCSHIRVTLVRGKSGWKVTGAEPLQNLYVCMKTREHRAFLRNITVLLKRVIRGETSHMEIFDDVIYACKHVETFESLYIEQVLSLRILHTLGYVAFHETFTPFLHVSSKDAFSATVLPDVSERAKQSIEHALIQSQL